MLPGYVGGGNKSLFAGSEAANVKYDNTVSGLTATDTQGAIDELNADLPYNIDYTSQTTLQLNSTTPVTITENGYVQFWAENNNATVPTTTKLIRGVINSTNVYQGMTQPNVRYSYVTSGLFPVKVGDVVYMSKIEPDDCFIQFYKMN